MVDNCECLDCKLDFLVAALSCTQLDSLWLFKVNALSEEDKPYGPCSADKHVDHESVKTLNSLNFSYSLSAR